MAFCKTTESKSEPVTTYESGLVHVSLTLYVFVVLQSFDVVWYRWLMVRTSGRRSYRRRSTVLCHLQCWWYRRAFHQSCRLVTSMNLRRKRNEHGLFVTKLYLLPVRTNFHGWQGMVRSNWEIFLKYQSKSKKVGWGWETRFDYKVL